QAGNGLDLWGATLYDFYHVRALPSVPGYIKISTGSKLTNVMKAFDELSTAKDQLAWAEREESPKEIPAWDPAEAIDCYERRVHLGCFNAYSLRKEVREAAVKSGTTWRSSGPENPCRPFPLQRGVPLHLLPKKLHVHDPWNLLSVNFYNIHPKEAWSSKEDVIHTYLLSLPSASREAADEASKAAAAEEDAVKEQTIMLLPQEEAGETNEPAIIAVLPKRPRNLTEVPEAHLYISPKGRLGEGHHSVVYRAEWELPRDLFCKSTICRPCVEEKVEGTSSSSAMEVDSSASQRKVGEVIIEEMHIPGETIHSPRSPATVTHPRVVRTTSYKGVTVQIYADVPWQNPSFPETMCKHRTALCKPVPRTAVCEVAAKLSLEHDQHLAREASNYVKFPAHFFQHWNGYNVVPPLHNPTPVGAVVPQFYGYYVPETTPSEYRSPILLIEHCGEPVEPKKLCEDDREECAALLFRFHYAGWLHESFAARNIVVQYGLPTTFPLERALKPTPSFRLIDFGRSREYDSSSERQAEEQVALMLFDLHHFHRPSP
ncbi:hypothetical protein F5I97DRAFT_1811584, partial [Phlebopus sp. FC_14]